MDCECKSHKPKGRIQIILGPMFSGKSKELIRRVQRFQIAKRACLLLKHAKDTRYTMSDQVCTHDRCAMDAIAVTSLSEARPLASAVDVVGIDEGQFFSDIAVFAEDMANAGKVVIIAALDGTYRREPFGNILNTVPLAESVVKLRAVCVGCHEDAAFTARIGSEDQVELIGGSEKYRAVCRTCHKVCGGDREDGAHP